MPAPPSPDVRCPCGLPRPYGSCCGALHAGTGRAATAELLMRSRYSAFAVGDAAYLLATWHPTTRPPALDLDPEQRWTALEVVGSTGGSLLLAEGTVAFRAHYRHAGRAGTLAENSRFVREGGRWSYVGPVPPDPVPPHPRPVSR